MNSEPVVFDAAALPQAITRIREQLHVVEGPGGRLGLCSGAVVPNGLAWRGTLPPMYPEWLGDRSFLEVHGVRYPYVAGAMANGIASTGLVIAMARAGMLAFFGAAGLSLQRIEAAVQELCAALRTGEGEDAAELPFGCNLIHAPHEPQIEAGTVELYLRYGVRRAEAAAFMALTLPAVRYAATGLWEDGEGRIHRRNMLFAKISRAEVARRFLSPAPEEMLTELVRRGELTAEEARLARRVPVSEDIIVEADSGGHTDNRPLVGLFPLIASVRDDCAQAHGYQRPIRIGAAGGIGTPAAAAAAFALGAAFVLTGSVNQGAVESGTSAPVKKLLAAADMADVAMAPAADMFEMGVEVQVLKRGTMFAARGHRLYELYQRYDSIEQIPAPERQKIEREIFRAPLEEIWEGTARFFQGRNPAEVAKAQTDPHHRMALIFRWYLGMASKWAITGDPARTLDYQIWCGPAMGAFNRWVSGSFLEAPEARSAVQIALNILEGAAVIARAGQLRSFGVPVPPEAFRFEPRPFSI